MLKITENCTGCRACEQLCGHGAIIFRQDGEGFWAPEINQDLCVDCGLCAIKCPQNLMESAKADRLLFKPGNAVAARLKNEHLLYKSASGGAFAGLALFAINNGWIVFGVRYDDDLVAHHGKAETAEELYSLLSSKYVQSDTRHTFREVRSLLREGKKVLYSGTGCQIGGLRSFLGKDYENLVTIDLVCHGVPSPLLFKKFIETLKNKHGGHKIQRFDFREKKLGWGLDFSYGYGRKNFYRYCSESSYYTNFLKGTIYRECCYTCPYARKERVADITIADYWGIEYVHPEFDDERGVSLVVLNSLKGGNMWAEAEGMFDSVRSDIDDAAKYNGNLSHPTKRVDSIRDHIYDGIWESSADEFINRRLPHKKSLITRVKHLVPHTLVRWVRRILNK